MAKVLIGGCGDVGSALGIMLAQRGHEVWGIRRNIAALPSVIRGIAKDLNQLTASDIPHPFDYAVFTAAASTHTEAGYRATYISGMQRFIVALRETKSPIKRLLLTSSTSVYGENSGKVVNEFSAANSEDWNGRLLHEAEHALGAAPWPTTSVRFGGIYGPGRNRMLRLAAQATPSDGPTTHITNRIHRDDCAGVLAFLLARENAPRHIVAVDEEPATQATVIDWLREKMDLPAIAWPQSHAPITGKRCDSATLRALGYRFSYPNFRAGYASMIAQWLAAPT